MKFLAFFLTVLATTTTSFGAKITHSTIDTAEISHCLASPQFAKALAEASEKTNGYKIRIEYTLDHTYRTTFESVTVNIVGRQENPAKYAQATFTLTALNGCMEISAVSPVVVTEISQEDFVEFKY